jgi:hypothetical protein
LRDRTLKAIDVFKIIVFVDNFLNHTLYILVVFSTDN